METSPEIKNLAKALSDFQASGVVVTKDGVNPHFKSTFATLPNVIETTREPLQKHGLSFAQFPDGDGLATIVMHTSGEWIKATAKLTIEKPTPQAHQSAITYMRRNALLAVLGLPAEDDDGEEASKPAQAIKGGIIRNAPKTDPSIYAQKKVIKDLLTELKEEPTPNNILFVTGLSVEDPKNLPAIIDRLEAIKDERNQK